MSKGILIYSLTESYNKYMDWLNEELKNGKFEFDEISTFSTLFNHKKIYPAILECFKSIDYIIDLNRDFKLNMNIEKQKFSEKFEIIKRLKKCNKIVVAHSYNNRKYKTIFIDNDLNVCRFELEHKYDFRVFPNYEKIKDISKLLTDNCYKRLSDDYKLYDRKTAKKILIDNPNIRLNQDTNRFVLDCL